MSAADTCQCGKDHDDGGSPRLGSSVEGKLGIRHVQAGLMFLGIVVAYATRSGMSVAIVAMVDANSTQSHYQTFDWNTEQVSIILSSFVWGLTATQILAGYASTLYSAKNIYACGILLSGVLHATTPIFAYYGGWILVTASRVAMGISQSCMMPCTQTLIARWAPPLERSRHAMFIYNGALLGNVIAMALSGKLASSSFGWPSVFYTFGLLTVGWSVLFYFVAADSPAEHTRISFQEKQYILTSLGEKTSDVERREKRIEVPWMAMMTSVPMWALIICSVGNNYGFFMLLTQMPFYFKYILDYDIDDSGIISALPYLCAWLVAFPISWLTDRCLKRGVSTTLVRKIMNSIALWGPALALLLLCVVETDSNSFAIAVMIAAVCTNTAVFCGYPVSQIEMSPRFAGMIMSITNCIGNASALVAPLMSGAIVTDMTNVGQWNTVFYITAFVFFLSNFVFVIFGTSDTQAWNEPAKLKLTSINA